MNVTVFSPQGAAHVLLQAERSGALLAALPDTARPADLLQGYDIQDAVIAARGTPRAGWKLGVGSPAQLKANDLHRPLIGQLAAERCHADGAQLRMPSADAVTIECEIAFVLARDIPPEPGRAPSAADVKHACVTLEVVRSRFIDRRAVGWPSFVADSVGFEALVISTPICTGLNVDVLRQVNDSVSVALDGTPRASALFGDAATDPVQSLAALFDHAAERGITLKAGEIVTTGAMCQPFNISGQGHVIHVTYAGGELRAELA